MEQIHSEERWTSTDQHLLESESKELLQAFLFKNKFEETTEQKPVGNDEAEEQQEERGQKERPGARKKIKNWSEEQMDTAITQYQQELASGREPSVRLLARTYNVPKSTLQRRLKMLYGFSNTAQSMAPQPLEAHQDFSNELVTLKMSEEFSEAISNCLLRSAIEMAEKKSAEMDEMNKRQDGQSLEKRPGASKRVQMNGWSEERMKGAIKQYQQEIESGNKPVVRLLARTWNVPKSTLQRRLKGVIRGFKHVTAGRKALLPPEAEKDLADMMVSLSQQGVRLKGTQVRTLAFHYAKANGIPGFSEAKETAGSHWFKGFMKRNPNVRCENSEDLSEVETNCILKSMLESTHENLREVDEDDGRQDGQSHEETPKAKKILRLNTWSEEGMEDTFNQFWKEQECRKEPNFNDCPLENTKMEHQTKIETDEEKEEQSWQSGGEGPSNGSMESATSQYQQEHQTKIETDEETEEQIWQSGGEGPSNQSMEATTSQYQQEIESGNEPVVRLVTRTRNVPKSTLQRRLKGVIRGFEHVTAGGKALLPPEAEKDLADMMVSLSQQGVRLKGTQVQTVAFQYAKANGIPGFSEAKETAGSHWFKGFTKRNPNVRCENSEDLSVIDTNCILKSMLESTHENLREVDEDVLRQDGQSDESFNPFWNGQESRKEPNLSHCLLEKTKMEHQTKIEKDEEKEGQIWQSGGEGPSNESMEAATSQYQQELESGKVPSIYLLDRSWEVPRSYLQRRIKDVVNGNQNAAGRRASEAVFDLNGNSFFSSTVEMTEGRLTEFHEENERQHQQIYNLTLETTKMQEQKQTEEEREKRDGQSDKEKTRLRKRAPLNTWSEGGMEAAISQYKRELDSGKNPKVRLLARIWNVPKSTLQRRVKGVVSGFRHASGRKALMPLELEKDIVDMLISLSQQGVCLRPTQVRTLAFRYAKAKGVQGFTKANGKAGFHWLKSFIKRNPNVCLKMPKDLPDVNANCLINSTTEMIEENLEELNEENKSQAKQSHEEQPEANKGAQLNTWSEESMEAAINQYQQELQSGVEPNVRHLANIWKVPKSTLLRRLKRMVSGSPRPVRRRALPPEAENFLVNKLTSLNDSEALSEVTSNCFLNAPLEMTEEALKELNNRKESPATDINQCWTRQESGKEHGHNDCLLTTMEMEEPLDIQNEHKQIEKKQPRARRNTKLNTWSEERMEAAINQYQQEVQSGQKTQVRLLARIWNVPKSTLQRRLKGVVSGFHHASGRKALLPPETENDIAKMLVSLSQQGVRLKPIQVQSMAFQYAKAKGIPGFPSTKDEAGDYWFRDFMKRNPDLGLTISGHFSEASTDCLLKSTIDTSGENLEALDEDCVRQDVHNLEDEPQTNEGIQLNMWNEDCMDAAIIQYGQEEGSGKESNLNEYSIESSKINEQESIVMDEGNEQQDGQSNKDQTGVKKRVKLNTWSEEGMKAALMQYQQELQYGKKPSVRLLARIWNVPKTTLRRRLKGFVSKFDHAFMSKVLLPPEFEKDLTDILLSLSQQGVRLTPTQIRSTAFQYAKAKGLHGFSHTIEATGFHWFKGFMKRNSHVLTEIPGDVSDAIWQQNYETLLTALDINNDLSHIWSFDEITLHENLSLLDYTGEEIPYEQNSEKAIIFTGFNGIGTFTPTMVIFKGQTLENSWLFESDGSVLAKVSGDGQINDELLYEWGQVFVSNLPKDDKIPHLLVSNCASCHFLTVDLISYLAQHNVHVLTYPSHTTSQTSRTHQNLFRSLKENWSLLAQKSSWSSSEMAMPRYKFFSLFLEAWRKTATLENAQAGFITSGMIPVKMEEMTSDCGDMEISYNQQEPPFRRRGVDYMEVRIKKLPPIFGGDTDLTSMLRSPAGASRLWARLSHLEHT